jgi:hypothetical protein
LGYRNTRFQGGSRHELVAIGNLASVVDNDDRHGTVLFTVSDLGLQTCQSGFILAKRGCVVVPTGHAPQNDGTTALLWAVRYDDLGTEDLEPSSRDPYRGPARHCRASVDPIAGFLRTGDHAGERASGLSTWLAAPLPDAAPVAVRMDLEGEHGTLHVHLARATPTAP